MSKSASFKLDDEVPAEKCEGFTGVDAFTRSTILPPDILQAMTNGVTRDNFECWTRFGLGAVNDAAWAAGYVQGMIEYHPAGGTKVIFAAVNGVFKTWDGTTLATVAGHTPADATRKVTFAKLMNKIYIADGSRNLFSYDPTNGFVDLGNNSTGQNNPPIGSIVVAHAGRLFMAGIDSEPDAIYTHGALDPSVGNWDQVKFQFKAGSGDGDAIVAMASMHADFLAVIKGNEIRIYDTPPLINGVATPSANYWPLRFKTSNIGGVGSRAFVRDGQQLLVMTLDGVRAISRMDGDGDSFESELPLSQPMQTYLDRINWSYVNTIVGQKYGHLHLWAVPLDSATTPDHILVFNTRLRGASSPFGQWCGVWKMDSDAVFNPMAMCVSTLNGKPRLLIGDTSGRVWQYKDYLSTELAGTFTDTLGATEYDIESRFKLRSMMWGEPESPKDGEYYGVEFVAGCALPVTINVYLDEVLARADAHDLEQEGGSFGDAFPVDFFTSRPQVKAASLIGLENFKEMYLEVVSSRGFCGLKRAAVGAFVNPLATLEDAA